MKLDLAELMKNPQVMKMVQSLVGQVGGKGGGQANLAGLADQLKKSGLPLDSWLGSGNNEQVTGAQLSRALGPQAIERAAQESGATPETINDVAKVLPELVNEASPDGRLDPDALDRILGEAKPAANAMPAGSSDAFGSGSAAAAGDNAVVGRAAGGSADATMPASKPSQSDYTGTIKQ